MLHLLLSEILVWEVITLTYFLWQYYLALFPGYEYISSAVTVPFLLVCISVFEQPHSLSCVILSAFVPGRIGRSYNDKCLEILTGLLGLKQEHITSGKTCSNSMNTKHAAVCQFWSRFSFFMAARQKKNLITKSLPLSLYFSAPPTSGGADDAWPGLGVSSV